MYKLLCQLQLEWKHKLKGCLDVHNIKIVNEHFERMNSRFDILNVESLMPRLRMLGRVCPCCKQGQKGRARRPLSLLTELQCRKRKSPTGKTHGTCTPFDLGERTACIELQSLNSHSKITIVSFPLLTIRKWFHLFEDVLWWCWVSLSVSVSMRITRRDLEN